MVHYLIELLLWMLAVFFAGCAIGYVLRRMAGRDAVVETVPAPLEAPLEIPPAPPPAKTVPAQEMGRMARPKGLKAARGGKPDKLQRIGGIGPKNEKVLHHQGFFHFDQIAAWTPGEIGWLDDHLKFNGRIEREQWVRQAKLLAEGKDEDFRKEFGGGRRG